MHRRSESLASVLSPLRLLALLLFCAIASSAQQSSLHITNVVVYDGSGHQPFRGEVRILGDSITAVGPHLPPLPGETLYDGHGLALAPGFIDMHSHADRGIFEQSADNLVRQGITTVVVGQDGDSPYPLADFLARLDRHPAQMNVASMAGHATMREQVMGPNATDLLREASPAEIARMKQLLEAEMNSGAFGLSSGLEYDAGHFATTDEVIELAKVAGAHHGFYISHVRDEGNEVFKSFDEVMEIGRRGHLPVEITHIKLGTTPVWHQAAQRMPEYFARAAREGIDLRADVYPYTYWHSLLRVIMLDRDYYNPEKVQRAIAENGGADRIHITRYAPEPAIEDKTLAEVAAYWKTTPVEAFMRIVRATLPTKDFKGAEQEAIVESMSDDDLKFFLKQPRIMFCTDGELHGKHPRGAGSFPRIFGHYVRDEKVLPLAEAVRKASALPAEQLHLGDRGRIAPGMKADLVLFDPAIIADHATISQPEAPPEGIPDVMVNGKWVVEAGKVTGNHPGVALRRKD